jgi:hypothetical protein
MDESEDEEFYEDFGAHLTAADCDRLLTRARESEDQDLRLLVKQYMTLRRTAADALAYVEQEYGERIPASTASKGGAHYPLGALRFLLEDVPRRG